MIKRIKSMLFVIKLKYYMSLVKLEMYLMVFKGKEIPDNYMWVRLDKLLRKEKQWHF